MYSFVFDRRAALSAEDFDARVVALPRSEDGNSVAARLGNFKTREATVALTAEYISRAPGREAVVHEAI